MRTVDKILTILILRYHKLTNITEKVKAYLKLNNIKVENLITIEIDDGKYNVADAKFNDVKIGVHFNKV